MPEAANSRRDVVKSGTIVAAGASENLGGVRSDQLLNAVHILDFSGTIIILQPGGSGSQANQRRSKSSTISREIFCEVCIANCGANTVPYSALW